MPRDNDTVDYLLWVDLETTGLHNEAEVIESAFIVTQARMPFTQILTWNFLHRPNDTAYHTMPQIVFNMHTDSGLWADLHNPDIPKQSKETVDEAVSIAIQEFFGRAGHKNARLRLAGSGVSHFDSMLLRMYFPKIWFMLDGYEHSVFNKPTADIGVVRRFLKMGTDLELPEDYPPSEGGTRKAHRALPDLEFFIWQTQQFFHMLHDLKRDADDYYAYLQERRIQQGE